MITATVFSVAVIFSCQASEQERRFPAELEVLAANAQDLLSATMSHRRRQGLQLRLESSLGTLRFLAREYLQATHQPGKDLLYRIDKLRREFKQGNWQVLAGQSRRLALDYPMVLTGLHPGDASPRAIRAGRHIYQHLCMGCHEHPDTTLAVPAPNLYKMVRSQPPREYLARLISGVHGTPAVALRNPFSDQEIAGLAAFLLQKAQTHSFRQNP